MTYRMRLAALLAASFLPLAGQDNYRKPPPEVLDVLNAPLSPSPILSPTRDRVLFAQLVRYPSIADLAEPMLRLGGIRINPRTNGNAANRSYFVTLSLRTLSNPSLISIKVPPGARLARPLWNADGSRFAVTNETADGIELWIGDGVTGELRLVRGPKLNPLLGSAVQWLPDQQSLIVRCIPEQRGAPPTARSVPAGPKIQDSAGAAAASSTYEVRDVLKNPHDADLFDYYTMAQLQRVDAASGRMTALGKPAVYTRVSAAPGGSHLLVTRLHRPYSYQRTFGRFPSEIEIWNNAGELIETLASKPLAEEVPIDGVEIGPRYFHWRPTHPATLVWAEALDGGNPKTKVPHRDRLMIKTPGGTPWELYKTEHRYWGGIDWIENGGLVLISDYDRDRRWSRTALIDADNPAVAPRTVWDRSDDEKYQHPGNVMDRTLPNGAVVVRQDKGDIFLRGTGSSPEGDRPFLDRLDLRTLESSRLFRSDRSSLEYVVDWIDPVAGTFLTWRQSPSDPPNLQVRTIGARLDSGTPSGEAAWQSTRRAVTHFPDPTPQLRGITKRLVTYARADGVPLSFTLYLPAGYQEGTRLPTVLWAYPLDYADKKIAGQVEGSSQEFTMFYGSSELFYLLRGYAVLADAAMPVVGPPETVYDNFIEQVVMNAKAAIEHAVKLGVTDPERVGVGGHSHGALMTATLLAHSNLFRAGVAQSGAYNHTLRPFGFQNERRTLYEARENYVRLSPTLQADRFKDPLLLIHGEIDANPGTVPMQSEKLYEAMRGVGKTVRLVMLPHESHGYAAQESIEHVLFEMISWFDLYVKNAPTRPADTENRKGPVTSGGN